MSEKLYAERDAMELDQIGGHYFKHVMAMTAESLHSKSDIAAELGFRDCNIQQLEQQLAEAQSKLAQMAAENACLKQSIEEVAEAFEIGTDGVLATAVDESLNLLTPETDAVLKRIQAQGVDMFASKCKEESKRAHSSDARDSWWVSGENADDFASQLRKGAQS